MKKLGILLSMLLMSFNANSQSESPFYYIGSGHGREVIKLERVGNKDAIVMKFNRKSLLVKDFFSNKEAMKDLGLSGNEKLAEISIVSPIAEQGMGHYFFNENTIDKSDLFSPSFLVSNFPTSIPPNIDLFLSVEDQEGLTGQYHIMVSYLVFRNSLNAKATNNSSQAISYHAELFTSAGNIEHEIYPFLDAGGLVKVGNQKIEL